MNNLKKLHLPGEIDIQNGINFSHHCNIFGFLTNTRFTKYGATIKKKKIVIKQAKMSFSFVK